jgi:uncharacterized protein (TIGR01777 family)
MNILIFGATGFVGTRLTKILRDKGHNVVHTDVRKDSGWKSKVRDADGVVNLGGAPIIGKRWNDAYKALINDSRVESTEKIVSAMGQVKKEQGKNQVLVNASAIGFYGPSNNETFTESSESGHDFLAFVCRNWEEAAHRAQREFGIRTVVVRIGIVLGKGGGALSKLILPFKLFAGGPVGSGAHIQSWVHIDDVCGMIVHALENASVVGPINAVAPNPVSNKEFSAALGRALHRPSWAPVPPPALYLLLGEVADLLVKGARVVPEVAQKTGYKFLFSDIDSAMKDAVS